MALKCIHFVDSLLYGGVSRVSGTTNPNATFKHLTLLPTPINYYGMNLISKAEEFRGALQQRRFVDFGPATRLRHLLNVAADRFTQAHWLFSSCLTGLVVGAHQLRGDERQVVIGRNVGRNRLYVGATILGSERCKITECGIAAPCTHI